MARRGATELVDELRRFTAERWVGEPADVRRLRSFFLPPMGNLPCVLYCNFDLFWAGEQLQVCRQAALEGDLRLPELTEVSALLLDRIAARTAKWEMSETVALMRRASDVLREWRPDTAQEFAVVLEHLMMAIDRIQAAVDAIIPWNELDAGVRLRASLG
jgi:hypothetical protein